MSQRLEIKVTSTTSSHIDSRYLEGMFSSYMNRYGRRMLSIYGGASIVYKFNGTHTESRILVKTKEVVKNKGFTKPDVDISRLVILGGVFQEIGGDDEAVGGGNQKVGSDNQ